MLLREVKLKKTKHKKTCGVLCIYCALKKSLLPYKSNVDILIQLFCFHYLAFVSICDMNTFEDCLSDEGCIHTILHKIPTKIIEQAKTYAEADLFPRWSPLCIKGVYKYYSCLTLGEE